LALLNWALLLFIVHFGFAGICVWAGIVNKSVWFLQNMYYNICIVFRKRVEFIIAVLERAEPEKVPAALKQMFFTSLLQLTRIFDTLPL
jgi:hypothetical protein